MDCFAIIMGDEDFFVMKTLLHKVVDLMDRILILILDGQDGLTYEYSLTAEHVNVIWADLQAALLRLFEVVKEVNARLVSETFLKFSNLL